MDRREFLRWMGGIGLGMMASGLPSGCTRLNLSSNEAGQEPLLPEWTGDTFPPMHRIRDQGSFPQPAPSQKADIVIIGGGLSGLTAAYKLKDENFLLLEREKTLGGNAKQGEYQGIPYAMGSAYLVDIDEPYGPLYNELGLSLKPVGSPVDVARLGGRWQSLESGPVASAFARLQKQFRQLLKSPDFPTSSLQAASANALRLDKSSFYDYLKADTPDPMLRVMDAYCYSALGGGIREISAYAGVNFYSEIAGDIYAFPGGNAYVAQRLAHGIAQSGTDRIKTGVSIYHIEEKDGQVLTSYFENDHPEQYHTVASKAVIVAVPYYFASRIITGIPSQQQQLMHGMQYGAYLVANCCFDRRVHQGGYDNWTPSNPVFTDFITADYVSNPAPKQNAPSVLTVYAPFRNAMAGRVSLLQGNRQAFAAKIRQGLQDVTGFPQGSLREIRLTRYGHQLLTSRVGLMGSLVGMNKVLGRIILAHSDGQGMAAIESAVLEGLNAVSAAKPLLRR